MPIIHIFRYRKNQAYNFHNSETPLLFQQTPLWYFFGTRTFSETNVECAGRSSPSNYDLTMDHSFLQMLLPSFPIRMVLSILPAVPTFLKAMEKRKEQCKQLWAYCKKPLIHTSRWLLIVRLHCSNGWSPAELSMGRKLRSRIPVRPEVLCPEWSYLKRFREADAYIRDKKKTLTDDIVLEICRRCSQKLMLG